MSKKTFSYFAWLGGIIAAVIFLFWFFDARVAPQEVRGGVSESATPDITDTVSTDTTGVAMPDSAASDGMRMVFNNAARYRIAVPVSWYVEKSGTTGMALYPDYDPQAASSATPVTQPNCKVAIAVLPNKEKLMLGDWLAAYLRQDPTADVVEISQTAAQTSGRAAITWIGSLNGVSTTLVYVTGDGVVYEIAPSVIAGGEQGVAGGDCRDSLDVVLKNFTIAAQ